MPNTDLDIALDGTHFRLKGPLSYVNLATLPPKIVIGDYTNDTNELMSSWVLTDLSGGHGVQELSASDTNRYRWAEGIYARYPSQWSLPYKVWSTNEDDGLYQPLCDGLTKYEDGSDFDWRHFSLRGRTIYVDNKDTGKTATARAVNKGVVFQGNGDRPLLFIPLGQDGYTIYDPTSAASGKGKVYNFSTPKFVGFALLDDKLVGIDQDGWLYKSVRSTDNLDTAINNTTDTTFKVDAPDVKYSKGIVIQINSEQLTITGIDKTNQKVTVTRGSSKGSHAINDKIFGVWYKYGGKARMPSGTDIRDLIIYLDRDTQPCVHIITDRSVWAFDDGGPRVFPTSLQFPQSPFSGVGSAVWRGDLYVAGGMDIYRYNGDVVSNIGLSRDDGLPRNYAGNVIDLAAGLNGLYALVRGRGVNNSGTTPGYDYWSVQEWSGSGWQTIWAEKMDWTYTTLNADISSATVASFTVTSNAKFEYGDIIKVNGEKMFVNSRSGSNTLNVRRGRYRTTATTHSSGDRVWTQRLPTFIDVSLAEPERMRVYWGVGHTRFYQEQPSEAVNPREDVENDSEVGFGRAKDTGSGFTYPSGTYFLESGRFDANMPGYIKIANAVELRLRRLPMTQIFRLYYKRENDEDWVKIGTVAGGDTTKLDGSINNSVTTLVVDQINYIEPGMYLWIENEKLKVVSRVKSTKTVTVTRGVGNTSPAAHANNTPVYVDFRIGTVQSGRNIFRFGTYADNYQVFSGKPFHMIEFRLEIKDQQGNVYANATLPSSLASGVVSTAKQGEDDDLISTIVATSGPSTDTFIIEHLSFSFLKLRAPSGSWVAELDLTQPWMDRSPEYLADKLDSLLGAQKFIAFQHKDKTYRVRLSQVGGSDGLSDDERMTRRVNIIEMPVTLGPLGDW